MRSHSNEFRIRGKELFSILVLVTFPKLTDDYKGAYWNDVIAVPFRITVMDESEDGDEEIQSKFKDF